MSTNNGDLGIIYRVVLISNDFINKKNNTIVY